MRANDSDTRTLDLIPFWKSGNEFHRSTDTPVRDFTKFQSTYPEFVGLENLSAADRKARIQSKVDALYDPTNRRRGIATKPHSGTYAIAGKLIGSGSGGPVLIASGQRPVHASGGQGGGVTRGARQAAFAVETAVQSVQEISDGPPPTDDNPEALSALQRLDWFIRVRVKKFQLKQSFTILFFLGPVPEDVAEWRTSEYLVGSHGEFVNSNPESCANCKENGDAITEGFIGLDDRLEEMGHGKKTEEQIENYITENIHWRVQKVSRHPRLPLKAWN
jgi:tyrosinase